MDRGAWRATVRGHKESDTIEYIHSQYLTWALIAVSEGIYKKALQL